MMQVLLCFLLKFVIPLCHCINISIYIYPTDSYEELAAFVRTVSEQGKVKHFIVHARKALLNGYVA